MIKTQALKKPQNKWPSQIILIAGAGQNVGKTTFACQLIKHIVKQNKQVYTVKISPHLHQEVQEYIIFENENFILSLEKQNDTGKDSSRMLAAGAKESFFLQVKDDYLEEAFLYTSSLIPEDVCCIVESGGLRQILKPFCFSLFSEKKKI